MNPMAMNHNRSQARSRVVGLDAGVNVAVILTSPLTPIFSGHVDKASHLQRPIDTTDPQQMRLTKTRRNIASILQLNERFGALRSLDSAIPNRSRSR